MNFSKYLITSNETHGRKIIIPFFNSIISTLYTIRLNNRRVSDEDIGHSFIQQYSLFALELKYLLEPRSYVSCNDV